MKLSEELYQWCIKYCEAHPDFKEFEVEYGLCKEIVQLIPLKIQRTLQAQLA